MSEFEGDPAQAEAELKGAGDKAMAAEDAVERAKQVVFAIEDENPDTPEAEADVMARMKIAEDEVERLEGERADADADYEQTVSRWQDQGYLPRDDDDFDEYEGWPLSPEREPT
jgi:hypothetical protein